MGEDLCFDIEGPVRVRSRHGGLLRPLYKLCVPVNDRVGDAACPPTDMEYADPNRPPRTNFANVQYPRVRAHESVPGKT